MTDEFFCMMCDKSLGPNYKPAMCCSGFDCGCRGMPTNPPICSDKCWDALMKRNQSGVETSCVSQTSADVNDR
jgi:hypothetical protein